MNIKNELKRKLYVNIKRINFKGSDIMNTPNRFRHSFISKHICIFLSLLIAFSTFITITFSNLYLSDYINLKNFITAQAAENSSGLVFYHYGELIGLYHANYQDQTEIQYKIGEEGDWVTYSTPFSIPVHKTTKIYARLANTNQITYQIFSNTAKALGLYSEKNTDFNITYNNITFPYMRNYNSADKKWFTSDQSNIAFVNQHIEITLPDGSTVPLIRESEHSYIDELNGNILIKENGEYIFDNGQYKYHFPSESPNNISYISAIEDYSGNKLNITHSKTCTSISDKSGRIFNIFSNNNQKTIVDANGNKIDYLLDNGQYTFIEDQADVIIGEYAYNDEKLITSMDKSIEYDENNRVKKVLYDNGSFINYTYDDKNMTYYITTSDGNKITITYNDALLPVEYIDEYGVKTEISYDNHYRIISKNINNEKTTYSYNPKGNITSLVSNNSENNLYYNYDQNGNIIREKKGDNYTYYQYDNNKNILITASLKSDYNGTIPNVYDPSLDCFDTVYYTYDDQGRIIKEKDDKNKYCNQYIYDNYGNIVKETTISTKNNKTTTTTTSYTYDDMGNVLSVVCGEESSYYIYDDAKRMLLSDENGECTRIIYDEYGRVVQEIESEDYDHSKDGLPEKNIYEDKNAGYIYSYCDNGNLSSIKNENGVISNYLYNDIGIRIYEQFDIYEINYTDFGNLKNIKIADEIKVSYVYDNMNHLSKEVYANGNVIKYKHDSDGRVSAKYRNNETEPYITYKYNEGELYETNDFDSGLKTVYGKDDSITIYKQSDNTIVSSYKEDINDKFYADSTSCNILESHFGNSVYSIIKDNSVSYETDNNILYISNSNTSENVFSNSVKYNNNNIITSLLYCDNESYIDKKITSYNHNNIRFISNRNTDKIITSTEIDDNIREYDYDVKNQLINKKEGNIVTYYKYDNRGNIIEKRCNDEAISYSYNDDEWLDLLTSVNGNSITYDENGNITAYSGRTFYWQNGRQLYCVEDNDNTFLYTYDDQGYRTSKTINGKTTYYNSKNGMILSQFNDNDNLYFQYDNNGTPFGFIHNNEQYFYVTDQFENIISIIDSNGNKIADYEYDDWGKLLSIKADNEKNKYIANLNPLRYRGYYYDEETGYYYLQSRYYDPNLCRFINADELMMAKCNKQEINGLNLFAYCCNNPIGNSDPTGYWKKDDHYSWTKSWIQSQRRGTVFDKIRSYADTIANQCRNLDIEYPSTAYAASGFSDSAKKSWQYFHFNGNKTGTDSRIEYSNDMLTNALNSWKYNNKSNALMYLGYGLHAIQDIEAHGQIGRGDDVPVHGLTADNPDYDWKDSSHTTLVNAPGNSQPRKDDTYNSTLNYLRRFCNAI